MSPTPRAGILTGFGINADVELAQAFRLAGAEANLLPVSSLVEEPWRLNDLQILAFPGGFSFGDHLGSGRVLALLIKQRLRDQLDEFTRKGGLILGVCNGFQTLVKLGILPNLKGDWTPETSLIGNDVGVFQDRWVGVSYNARNTSPWVKGLTDSDLPIRHGEGRFQVADAEVLKTLHRDNLVAVTYRGTNPNGAVDGIAGITDKTGRIFGLMPHPEAFVTRLNHPQWRRRADVGPLGLEVFKNGVKHFQ